MKKLTVVIAIKNRSEKSATNCVDSLLGQTHSCDITIVDFGSLKENLIWERKIFSKINFIEAKTNLNPYSSSKALNIGIKRVKTPFTLITDIDLIFSKNFIEEVMKVLDKKTLVLSQRINLDVNGDEVGLNPHAALGTCIGISTSWLKKVRGFDEKYTCWGREDYDLVERAKQSGFKSIWITDRVKIKHQWHPTASRETLKENIEYYNIPNKPLIRNPKKWGEL